eukprot:TRINITY_DN22488_c0_g1_i8.p1 TRINITY_DN22488_c0_g1~~TRINITY_DN22488_c0_g1_i8.p1  ORF type:complete len:694 (+),score=141.72 TRINITY_DN22488_c0_g1_i8:147-2084(+)
MLRSLVGSEMCIRDRYGGPCSCDMSNSALLLLLLAPALGSLPAFNPPCGNVLYPGQRAFTEDTAIDNGLAGKKRVPAMVVEAVCVQDVAATMAWAKNHSIPFAVKGGGHSAAGYSLAKGGVVLDMHLMNQSRVVDADGQSPTMVVQPGARFEQVYGRLDGTGLLFIGGGCSSVGVGGFMLGGGISFLSRTFGLGSDNLLAIHMVAPNGTTLRCSDTENTELFWALRGGGGGNFGVVVEFVFQLHRHTAVVEEVCWHGNEAAAFALPRYSKWLENAPSTVGAPALLLRLAPPPPPSAPSHLRNVSFCVTLFTVNPLNVTAHVESLVEYVGPKYQHEIMSDGCAGGRITPYYEWESRCGNTTTNLDGDDGYMMSSVLMPGTLDDGELAKVLVDQVHRAPGERTLINFHDGGGKIATNKGKGSFAHRDYHFIYQVKTIWTPAVNATENNMQWAAQLRARASRYSAGAYLNYIDPLLPDWSREYYGANYPELVRIKNQVDPDNFFRFEQSIGSHEQFDRSSSCEGAVAQMYAFQAGQNARDFEALGKLFTPGGTTYVPASTSTPNVGRAAVAESFREYFGTLASIEEAVTGPMLINVNWGGFSKVIRTRTKAAPTVEHVANVVNWFVFDCSSSPPLIQEFRAIFNASSH